MVPVSRITYDHPEANYSFTPNPILYVPYGSWGTFVQLNPQPLPPGTWVQLNPQPLPPRYNY